jgi:serine/threonine protein kinase
MTNAASALTKLQIRKIFPSVAERYELLGHRPIGEPSGFGAVWKARDLWLGREVALKVSNSDMTDELRLCRDIEGQTVRVYDYFRSDAGWNAYAMELLEAPWMSVSGFIEGHKYKLGDLQHYFDCFEIARSLLSGLSQIHGRPYSRAGGFVHADIKPDNLFLLLAPKKRAGTVFRLPPADSLVKILDMGISTAHGNALFAYTPAYSPKKKVARPGVDLYAVAVTFVELLTGERPCRKTMGHKARIRAFIGTMPSGSDYIDKIALEFASNCANACSRPGETVRIHSRYLDNQVFSINGLDLTALRAIGKNFPGGAKKDELAEFLFGILAPSHRWKNRTEQRLEWLKEMVTGLYQNDMLSLRGQRYFAT